MTIPFWSGTSSTSRPMASQRDGPPPAPTPTFLDSRYEGKRTHTNTLSDVLIHPEMYSPEHHAHPATLCVNSNFFPLPSGGAIPRTFFWRSPGLIGWWVHPSQKGAYLYFLLVISLSTSHFTPATLPPDRLLSLCPLPASDLHSQTRSHTHTQTHKTYTHRGQLW